MFLKVQYIQRVNGGGGVVFATGTPIANSVAEMFTMQRYLQMPALTTNKDCTISIPGRRPSASRSRRWSLRPDGAGYRLNTRFARFINVPELMQQFRQVADIQTAENVEIARPGNSEPASPSSSARRARRN